MNIDIAMVLEWLMLAWTLSLKSKLNYVAKLLELMSAWTIV